MLFLLFFLERVTERGNRAFTRNDELAFDRKDPGPAAIVESISMNVHALPIK